MIRSAARSILRRFPGLYFAWMGIRPKPAPHAEVRRVYESVALRTRCRVAGGPFIGLTYFPSYASLFSFVLGTAATPKLVGSYEEELHPTIGMFVRRQYERVVNIGCAEGYYAVGLARLLPNATILAFDRDPLARSLCARLARMNSVQDRLLLRGRATPAQVERAVVGTCLLLVDCEGCEADLLTSIPVDRFASCDILVETHEFVSPGSSSFVSSHFQTTHSVSRIGMQGRDPSKYPVLQHLPPDMQRLAVNEYRPLGEAWLFFTPR